LKRLIIIFCWGAIPAVIGSVNVLAVAERGCGGFLWSPPRPFGQTASTVAGYLIPSGRRAAEILKAAEKIPFAPVAYLNF